VGWPDTSPDLKGGAESVMDLVRAEVAVNLHSENTFLRWATNINNTRDEVFALLSGLKAAGKTIAAYGAPAKVRPRALRITRRSCISCSVCLCYSVILPRATYRTLGIRRSRCVCLIACV